MLALLLIRAKIVLHLDGHNFDAKLDDNGIFSAAIDAHLLVNSPSKTVVAELIENKQVKLQTTHSYKVNNLKQPNSLISIFSHFLLLTPKRHNICKW